MDFGFFENTIDKNVETDKTSVTNLTNNFKHTRMLAIV